MRDAALRWPNWWHADLFGPPHRELDLPMLTELRERLVRLRLLRRRGRALHATKRGVELAGTPGQLVQLLRDDMAHEGGIDATTWRYLSERLQAAGPEGVPVGELERELLDALTEDGWQILGGGYLGRDDLWHILQPLRLRGEAYGLIATTHLRPGAEWRLRSTDFERPSQRAPSARS